MSAAETAGKRGPIRVDKREAAAGFGWTLVFALVNKVALPLLGFVIARALGPEQMGAFQLLYALYLFSEVFRDAGLSQTYMRDQEVDGRREGAYMALGVLQGLVPAGVLFFAKEELAAYYGNRLLEAYMPWICAGLVINGFGTIPRAKVLRQGFVVQSGMREMIANVVAICVALGMILAGFGFVSVMVQVALNCLLNVAISYGLAPVRHFRFDLPTMWDTLRAASSTMGASLLFNLYFLSDNFVIGKLLGTADVGLYGRAKNLAQMPMQFITTPMMRPLQVAFSQSSADLSRLGEIYARSLAAAVMFVVPVFGAMVYTADPLVRLMLGPEWLGAIPVVQILCVYFGARTIGTLGGTALVAGGFARLTMASWLLCYLAALAAIVAAYGRLSLEALAWAYAAGAVVVYALHTAFALRKFPPSSERRRQLGRAAAASLVSAALLAPIYWLPLSPWGRLGLAALALPALHLGVLGWLLRGSVRAFMSPSGVRALYQGL